MVWRILNSKSKNITSSAVIVALSVGVSAVLGLLRDRLLAGEFGATENLDMYFAAFRVPDMVYGILITGGIVAAFLPVFAESFEKKKEEGWKLANNLLNLLFLLLIGVSTLLFFFAPYVVKIIAPGFDDSNQETTVLLTRIMMLSPILLGVSSLFSGILQYFNRFLVYSLAPIMYNLGIIFAILFFVEPFGLIGLAYGVILGSLLHLLIQLPVSFFCGYSYRPLIDLSQKELRKVFRLVVPRLIAQSSAQINLIVITAIASTLAAGSIAIFNFADHLQAFPVRVIGVSFAIAAFPAFSRALAGGDKVKFLQQFSSVMRQVLFFIIPLSVFIFLLRAQIVRVILGTGEFDWSATMLTAASLGIFSLGLFAMALVHVLIRAFFALQDTKTPLYAALFSMGLNIGLSFFFVWLLGFDNLVRNFLSFILRLDTVSSIEVIAFPLALLFSGIVHLLFLLYFLKRSVGNIRGKEMLDSFLLTFAASLVMGLAVFVSIHAVDQFIYLETFVGRFYQISVAFLVALVVYFYTSKLMRSPEIHAFYNSLIK